MTDDEAEELRGEVVRLGIFLYPKIEHAPVYKSKRINIFFTASPDPENFINISCHSQVYFSSHLFTLLLESRPIFLVFYNVSMHGGVLYTTLM